MKELLVNNEFYKIEVDKSKNFLYLSLFKSNDNYKQDKNITNNILSHFMYMDKGFNLILDFRFFDMRTLYDWFQYNLNRIAIRMEELDAGEQAHILNDFFWYILWSEIPELNGVKPLIAMDSLTKKLIGRFDDIEDGEFWLTTLKAN